jgi:hypothetical protein
MIRTRNRIPWKVKSVTSDGLSAKRKRALASSAAILNSRSMQTKIRKEGDDVFVMIKATETMIENPEQGGYLI